ncbi:MAG: serine hydrolase [Actinobacteria bacterium]|nr:serine hydrolase [Actinomycetota bacterium]
MAAATPICVSAQHPRAAATMSANIANALASRPHSIVGIAATDTALGVTCALNPTAHFYSASVIKVTILSALLYKIGGVGNLTTAQRNLASAMITQSSNTAASTLWGEVGIAHMQTFLSRAGMTSTVLNSAWGLTKITPRDELTQLRVLSYPSLLGPNARAYVLSLMAKVIASQRWGVSASAPSNVTVHLKNGWLNYPASVDWNINSIGVFTGTNINYQIAVLNHPAAGGQSESYGIQTVQSVAGIINRNLAGLYALFG